MVQECLSKDGTLGEHMEMIFMKPDLLANYNLNKSTPLLSTADHPINMLKCSHMGRSEKGALSGAKATSLSTVDAEFLHCLL